MNSIALTISSVLAVIAAIAILPVSPAAAGISLVVVGILAVFVADYGRSIKPLAIRAEIIPFNSTGRVRDRLSAAA